MEIYKKSGAVELIHLTILDACPVQGTLPAMREKPGQGVLGLLGGQPQAHPQSYHFSYSNSLGLVGSVLSNTVRQPFPKLTTQPKVSTKKKGRPGQTVPDKLFMNIIIPKSYHLCDSYLPGTL